jgi:hypothetical protein
MAPILLLSGALSLFSLHPPLEGSTRDAQSPASATHISFLMYVSCANSARPILKLVPPLLRSGVVSERRRHVVGEMQDLVEAQKQENDALVASLQQVGSAFCEYRYKKPCGD